MKDSFFRELQGIARSLPIILGGFTVGLLLSSLAAKCDETPRFETLAAEYERDVRPLLTKYCLKCHSSKARQGDLDLERFVSLAHARQDTKVWLKVAEQLDQGEMPPEEAKQLKIPERKLLRGWVDRYSHAEALAREGDPGPVGLRRLNNVEYTWTVRDLTGIPLDPAREFPVDSAAGEGFTNAGNALSMSPATLSKYFDAGKEIASHAVLLPDGFRFSKHTTRSDWTEEILTKIRELYRARVDVTELGSGTSVGVVNLQGDCRLGQLGRVPLEKYFRATIAEREAISSGGKSIAGVAAERGLNAKYLGILWTSLNSKAPSLLLDALRKRWRDAKLEDSSALAGDVAQWQRGLWSFNQISLMGRKGSRSRWMEAENPLVTQHEMRLKFPPAPEGGKPPENFVVSLVTTDAGDGAEHDFVIWREPRLVAAKQPDVLLRDIAKIQGLAGTAFGKTPDGHPIDPASLCVRAPYALTIHLPGDIAAGRELVVTAELDAETGREGCAQVELASGVVEAKSGPLPSTVTVTLSKVKALYPEHRTITYQHPFLIAQGSPLRSHLEADFEAYRLLFPASFCYPQVVPADEVLTLTQFHREDEPMVRLLLDDAERRQLDQLWAELRYVSQDPLKLCAVLDSLLETLKNQQQGGVDPLIEPLHKRAGEFRKRLIDDEPIQVQAIVDFAARAYRRLLEPAEVDELRGLYKQLRAEKLSHEEAFRLTLARVFVASPFLYRLEAAHEGAKSSPVSDIELAIRLSYFLWSSIPDDELRKLAEAGQLSRPEVLEHQTRRMLRDPRIRRLATEFACQWLHIYEFPVTEMKSEQAFPEFKGLRDDMYEEAIRFFTDLFQRDASLLSVLDADFTFVNERLAKFYGVEGVTGEDWRRIDGLRQQGRGGILGLSATLAKQSGAARTSPILRGNWISEMLLGEKLPRPPKNVPQLADTVPAGLSERQLIERHSSDVACAKCHQRIDPFGFALEGFNGIGRRRRTDLAGRPIDTKTKLPDGREIDGLAGLRDYLTEIRREAFVRQFCRKLLGYALGRETQLSDQRLLKELERKLTGNDDRLSVALLSIVQSRQFREIRGSETE